MRKLEEIMRWTDRYELSPLYRERQDFLCDEAAQAERDDMADAVRTVRNQGIIDDAGEPVQGFEAGTLAAERRRQNRLVAEAANTLLSERGQPLVRIPDNPNEDVVLTAEQRRLGMFVLAGPSGAEITRDANELRRRLAAGDRRSLADEPPPADLTVRESERNAEEARFAADTELARLASLEGDTPAAPALRCADCKAPLTPRRRRGSGRCAASSAGASTFGTT